MSMITGGEWLYQSATAFIPHSARACTLTGNICAVRCFLAVVSP